MINTNVTVPPQPIGRPNRNSAVTVPPGDLSTRASEHILPGEVIAGAYCIDSLLSGQGGQSDTYLAHKRGKAYVIKLYHEGCRPDPIVQAYLTDTRHPNIARIIECSDFKGRALEVYEYYTEGTLEQTKDASYDHIRKVIIPSINEGLYELHKNGIVHCDIKPSNLFYVDNGSRVVIGDFGISGVTDANGKLIGAARGTPEYSPIVRSIQGSAVMSPAYDYGSFGLVICRMILGRSLFSGMSVEDISRAWEGWIELPPGIERRFSSLVHGLIIKNEEMRWGYREVKRWGEGEFMPTVRGTTTCSEKAQSVKPLLFGTFDGEMLAVTSLHQLAEAIKDHWEQATVVVRRSDLKRFVQQFDRSLPNKVASLAKEQDSDAGIFQLLLLLEEGSSEICYCGRKYESLSAYVNALASGNDPAAIRFLSSGMLVKYLREMGYENNQVDKLEQLISVGGKLDMVAICTICAALRGSTRISVFGKPVETLDALVSAMLGHTTAEIGELIASDSFMAWLFGMGYGNELEVINEIR